MTIRIGDRIPSAVLSQMSEQGPQPIQTTDYFAGRKVVLFSVPGAFTPTCSAYHLPGFVEHADEFSKADGIDMLADGNGDFAKVLGLEMDGSAFGMGKRSQRFALVADDGIVTQLLIEASGEFRVSSAESVLATLQED